MAEAESAPDQILVTGSCVWGQIRMLGQQVGQSTQEFRQVRAEPEKHRANVTGPQA